MLTPIDLVVLVVYAVGVIALGLRAGGRQSSTDEYFLGGKDLPWWAVCFSVVATETSTLTVIGVPAVAYGGALTFLQLTIGYLIGRVIVAGVLLPRYFAGEQQTAYAFLGDRFGDGMRGLASVTFLLTRLLADGVRLFATAIPIQVIATRGGARLGLPRYHPGHRRRHGGVHLRRRAQGRGVDGRDPDGDLRRRRTRRGRVCS